MSVLSVICPSLDCGSKVWEGHKAHTASVESIMLGGANCVHGCSYKTSNETIWEYMGLVV